jgi:membrane fusion protein (multidrug efflux system)
MDGDARVDARPPATGGGAKPAKAKPKGPPKAILLVALLVFAGAGTAYWWWSSLSVSTDDAQIDGSIHQIAAQVSGRVIAVPVDDNQHVKKGETLVELDPRDYQVKLDQAIAQKASAEAQVADAQAQLGLRQAGRDQSASNVQMEEANLLQAKQDFDRYSKIDPHAITRQQLDQATAALHAGQARLDANRHAVKAADAQVKQAEAAVLSAQAAVANADAGVENARLQLSYVRITAPVDGSVTQKKVEIGNYISPGQMLMNVVADDTWITANFKETQLAGLHPGAHVSVTVDAYPGVTFDAHIESIQRGTGGVFSTLPTENATGNYVKVVQRVPVKIVFDHLDATKYPMSLGMSVNPVVKLNQ